MEKYIAQLLEDIKAAQRPVQEPFWMNETKSFEEEMAEIERWIERGEPEHDFSYYCGLKSYQFPPEERLTSKQVKTLNEALKDLLFSWNLAADIPRKLPARMAYLFLVSTLDLKVEIVDSGCITFEFCHYEPKTCPFKKYCTCRKFKDEMKKVFKP